MNSTNGEVRFMAEPTTLLVMSDTILRTLFGRQGELLPCAKGFKGKAA